MGDAMNKGFSDDELTDIMNEIESLEKEFSDTTQTESHHEVLSELTEMTLEEATMVQKVEHDVENNVHHISNFKKEEITSHHVETHSAKSSMSFKVSGQMTLELGFDVAGTSVAIHVDEKNGLTVELEGGMKFQIPVHANAQVKKVS